MKFYLPVSICLFFLLILSMPVSAQEFQWIDDFNQAAANDVEAFKSKMTQRFGAEMGKVESIIKEVKTPSDAYMTFKLSEMADKPVSEVARTYSNGKAKGWGALAKSLGIKPGSKEFHALKKGHDLNQPGPKTKAVKKEDKEEKKNKGKGKNKNKQKGKK